MKRVLWLLRGVVCPWRTLFPDQKSESSDQNVSVFGQKRRKNQGSYPKRAGSCTFRSQDDIILSIFLNRLLFAGHDDPDSSNRLGWVYGRVPRLFRAMLCHGGVCENIYG